MRIMSDVAGGVKKFDEREREDVNNYRKIFP